MEQELKNKKILITGGAGSIGTALIKEFLKYNVDTIRVLDISENEIHKLRNNFIGETRMRYLIGDVRDLNRLKLAMEDIDIVVHLAAMKHVHVCEYNPFEAVKTNVDGLQNVINCSKNENVEKVIFTSTDKAAHPLSVMGMTKLMGEKLISSADFYKGSKKTLFASVRFGNVIGSNGSVMPLFKRQILNGEPIKINDKEMTRFVITMDEAVKLICKAVELVRGGETFVWKMKTLKITDLADSMMSKYANGKEIKVNVAEKEEGEKIHEEIMSDEELSRAVELDNLYIIFPMVDQKSVRSKYQEAKPIADPVIASNMGVHLSKEEISKLLDIC